MVLEFAYLSFAAPQFHATCVHPHTISTPSASPDVPKFGKISYFPYIHLARVRVLPSSQCPPWKSPPNCPGNRVVLHGRPHPLRLNRSGGCFCFFGGDWRRAGSWGIGEIGSTGFSDTGQPGQGRVNLKCMNPVAPGAPHSENASTTPDPT